MHHNHFFLWTCFQLRLSSKNAFCSCSWANPPPAAAAFFWRRLMLPLAVLQPSCPQLPLPNINIYREWFFYYFFFTFQHFQVLADDKFHSLPCKTCSMAAMLSSSTDPRWISSQHHLQEKCALAVPIKRIIIQELITISLTFFFFF